MRMTQPVVLVLGEKSRPLYAGSQHTAEREGTGGRGPPILLDEAALPPHCCHLRPLALEHVLQIFREFWVTADRSESSAASQTNL